MVVINHLGGRIGRILDDLPGGSRRTNGSQAALLSSSRAN